MTWSHMHPSAVSHAAGQFVENLSLKTVVNRKQSKPKAGQSRQQRRSTTGSNYKELLKKKKLEAETYNKN